MANTPYRNLGTEDILSGHLSGIQSDINKMQEVLNMQTSSRSGHSLIPVTDQDDASLRYRIYEGSIRNWLDTPNPVIYRDGEVVNESEYVLQAPYGLIVFHAQQSSESLITADFNHIDSESKIITDIENNINSTNEDVSKIDGQITELEENPIGIGVSPFYMSSGSYMSHQKRNYDPLIDSGYNRESHSASFNILVYGDTIDAFPFPITTETTFKQAGIMLGDRASGNVDVQIGLYKDNGNLYPDSLVFQTSTISVEPDSWGYADINETIPAGLYWIARHDGGTAYWNGIAERSVINIQKFNAETFLQDLEERPNPFTVNGGYRATGISFGSMPSTFPSGIELFRRDDYCTPWLITE